MHVECFIIKKCCRNPYESSSWSRIKHLEQFMTIIINPKAMRRIVIHFLIVPNSSRIPIIHNVYYVQGVNYAICSTFFSFFFLFFFFIPNLLSWNIQNTSILQELLHFSKSAFWFSQIETAGNHSIIISRCCVLCCLILKFAEISYHIQTECRMKYFKTKFSPL